MKVHLILIYHKQGENVWADVEAYTSPRERDKALLALETQHGDLEGVDVEVKKRKYDKAGPPGDVEPANAVTH